MLMFRVIADMAEYDTHCILKEILV